MLRALLTVVCLLASSTPAATLREVARIEGQNEYVLQGIGLVVGLSGTGDSGKELVMARPLAEVLRRLGNEVPDYRDLQASRSAALVMVTCTIPRSGAKAGDKLDVRVSVLHSAASLRGGMLLAAPLTSAVPNDIVYAIASGPLVLEDDSTATVGFVSGGADLVQNIETTPRITTAFSLIVDQHFAGWGPAAEIASEINQQYLLTTAEIAEPLATVVDPRTIRVAVPENERGNVAAFVADVLDTDVGSALRRLPAQVICSTRTGIILITGDVQVSPAVITHRDLTITTTVPPPTPSIERPMVERSNWAAVETNARATETARLQDLMDAFDQLDVPPRDQIHILQMLHKAGKLHARLIVDEG